MPETFVCGAGTEFITRAVISYIHWARHVGDGGGLAGRLQVLFLIYFAPPSFRSCIRSPHLHTALQWAKTLAIAVPPSG